MPISIKNGSPLQILNLYGLSSETNFLKLLQRPYVEELRKKNIYFKTYLCFRIVSFCILFSPFKGRQIFAMTAIILVTKPVLVLLRLTEGVARYC